MTTFTEPKGATAIEVRGLTKRFGATLAVDDLSFTTQYGRVVGFLGPNGAGKTTALRALVGLIAPSAGHATIGGCRYDQLTDPARTVGACLGPDTFHPARTGRDHLRVLARAAGVGSGRVREVLKLLELGAAADRRAGGYSLGMGQRLGLAAALLGDPRVLILDEPANGLDPQGIRWLRDFLRSLAAEGRSVLLSSHVLPEIASTVDDVVVISGGHAVARASLEELLDGAASGVRIAGPDGAVLAETLRAAGARVDPADGSGMVLIHDRTVEEVARTVARDGLVITTLGVAGASLEDIYFGLTGGGKDPHR